MPIFKGNKDAGIQRLFIEMPDQFKGEVVWKFTDAQIMQHSTVNVDIDYEAVFTNLGKVIGTFPPGRYTLGEGASLAFSWLVDRLTGNAYYDAELYFVTTRDIPNIDFGGPIDNVSDKESGLIVTLRVFGNIAFKVLDPTLVISKLVGSDGLVDHNQEIKQWIIDQTLASIRSELPPLVQEHGILYLGAIQNDLALKAIASANTKLANWGLAISSFGELNVNLKDEDAQSVKKLAEAKAFTQVAGSYDEYAKGQAMLNISQGVEEGHVDAQPGMMVGMMMGTNPVASPTPPVAPTVAPQSPSPLVSPAPAVTPPAPGSGSHFCSNCGTPLNEGTHFCPNCGNKI